MLKCWKSARNSWYKSVSSFQKGNISLFVNFVAGKYWGLHCLQAWETSFHCCTCYWSRQAHTGQIKSHCMGQENSAGIHGTADLTVAGAPSPHMPDCGGSVAALLLCHFLFYKQFFTVHFWEFLYIRHKFLVRCDLQNIFSQSVTSLPFHQGLC